jgi:hypothetical protein
VCLPRPHSACRLVPCLCTHQLTVYTIPPSLLIYQGSADLDQLKRCIPPVTFLLTVNPLSSLQLTRPTKPHQPHYSTHIHIYLPSNLHSSILYLHSHLSFPPTVHYLHYFSRSNRHHSARQSLRTPQSSAVTAQQVHAAFPKEGRLGQGLRLSVRHHTFLRVLLRASSSSAWVKEKGWEGVWVPLFQ